jgi:hypothetical protein
METWDEVVESIRTAVDAVAAEAQEFAILTLMDDHRYVQWIGSGDELRVEVSSNEALGAPVVSPSAVDKLRDLGVVVDAPEPNYVYEPATADLATALIVRVLREVFEVQPAGIREIDLG